MEVIHNATRQQRRKSALAAKKVTKKQLKATGGLPKLEPSERINVYSCPEHDVVTIDRFKGVSPMMIKCPHCGHMAFSRWYKVDQDLKPEFEWTQPDLATLRTMPLNLVEHLQQGGLWLRKIEHL